MRGHRIVLIDESHNLRNRQGKRYRAIREYIDKNDSKCILLSATPYNKTYQDLSNQLRLFVSEDEDLGIRPEQLIRQVGETEFLRKHQASLRSIGAFEQSEHADDWRELMRLYLVRRTRSFIQANYAQEDKRGRKHLLFADGSRAAFPSRVPNIRRRRARQGGIAGRPARGLLLFGVFTWRCHPRHLRPRARASGVLRDVHRRVQSAMEKEFLTFVLRGSASVIVCPARGIGRMRLPAAWRAPLERGRMLLLSCFDDKVRRPTRQTVAVRNALVAELGTCLLVPHAEPEGKVEQLCLAASVQNKQVFTLASAGSRLTEQGATKLRIEKLPSMFVATR